MYLRWWPLHWPIGRGSRADRRERTPADKRERAREPWYYRPPIVRRMLFAYELFWFVVLIVLAFAYFKSKTLQNWVPTPLQDLPVKVAWFGTLGGVAISLRGVYEHAAYSDEGKNQWEKGWPLWYLGRPFSGLLAGVVSYILLKAVYPSGTPTPAVVLAVAFILGTQENQFFAFLARVGAVVVSVPDAKSNDSKQTNGDKKDASGAAER